MANLPHNRPTPVFVRLMSWLLLGFILMMALNLYKIGMGLSETQLNISYTELLTEAKVKNLKNVTVGTSGKIYGTFKSPIKGTNYFKGLVGSNISQGLADKLYELDPETQIRSIDDTTPSAFVSWLPTIIMVLIFIVIFRLFSNRMGGDGAKGNPFNFGKSKAKLSVSTDRKVTFEDVAGQEEAKDELVEIVEFLRNPSKFQRLGGKIPKGVLMIGPPGVGKTLLARSVAGEAKVPFLSISGSDFVEMFVGVGASRVRDLFEQARANAPCIIFIDEIDAVAKHRGTGLGNNHDEREQTLNQLLSEMDGFETSAGIIILAATNRPDVLDPALLRPGRFDRRVVLSRPDIKGREAILKVHSKKIPINPDVNLMTIAKGTPGLTGADLEALLNEAALHAARQNKENVTNADLEFAKDKVLMGSERRSMIISEKEKWTTAVHEAGHALLSLLVPEADPLHMVTIIPRGMAMGLTQQVSEDDKHNYSKTYLDSLLIILMGGRCAEEILLNGQKTTGASNDIERATDLAHKMICEWGMSSLGPLKFGTSHENPFLGKSIGEENRNYSEETSRLIDTEKKTFILTAHRTAAELLLHNKKILIAIANQLKERETLTGDEIRRIAGL